MKKNVGGWDRTVRIILGLVATAAMMVTVAFGEAFGDRMRVTLVAVGFLLLAFVFLGTAGAEKCLINRFLGRNTYNDHTTEERS